MAASRYHALRAFGLALEEVEDWPRPICPVCGDGHVAFEEPVVSESSESRRWRGHRGWEPYWITGTFRATGVCEKPSCKQEVVATGTYSVGDASRHNFDWEEEASGYQQFSTYYRVEHFSPPLSLLMMPNDAPDEVRDGVTRAAKLLYLDPGFAATALRASIERFLTSAGVEQTNDRGGFISLDRRLKQWRQSTGHDRIANLLLAVKWIGNAGTHDGGDLTVLDVLDGVEFIDEAFHSLYVAPDVDARAQLINERRGRSAASVQGLSPIAPVISAPRPSRLPSN